MVDVDLEILKNSIINLDFVGADKAVNDVTNRGISPTKAIESVRKGMDIVGEKFENMEFFLPEL